MAVVPKHKDSHQRYDPSQDLTQDQLHRFGKVASSAQKRREKLSTRQSVLADAKDAAFKPIIQPKKNKPNTVRYAVWMIVVMAVSLWLMYMSG
ncbi:hypothetical protein OH458_14095 [Vibrio sp. MarTm2]|uniref:hypothetical protein n=1 Tax=unclassified Vibrio TaxID=2614977 RepID=UPI000300A3DB|nr:MULTISPECIES: hypothetical protein [unclassified Vibrio]MDA0129195.1 hypothetical protein [Vibrio sp. MarTm2]CAK4075350.1 hypothetical protein VDT1_3946 [Vibrio sp. 16]